MNKDHILNLVQYIATQTINLKNKYIDEKDLPIDYLTIFSHSEKEFDEMKQILSLMGKLVGEHNGSIYSLNEPIKLPMGQLKFLRIRHPDIERPQKGCDDFRVNDYLEFKKKYQQKFGENIILIKRKDFEMIELKDLKFDVLTYFPSFSFSESLSKK